MKDVEEKRLEMSQLISKKQKTIEELRLYIKNNIHTIKELIYTTIDKDFNIPDNWFFIIMRERVTEWIENLENQLKELFKNYKEFIQPSEKSVRHFNILCFIISVYDALLKKINKVVGQEMTVSSDCLNNCTVDFNNFTDDINRSSNSSPEDISVGNLQRGYKCNKTREGNTYYGSKNFMLLDKEKDIINDLLQEGEISVELNLQTGNIKYLNFEYKIDFEVLEYLEHFLERLFIQKISFSHVNEVRTSMFLKIFKQLELISEDDLRYYISYTFLSKVRNSECFMYLDMSSIKNYINNIFEKEHSLYKKALLANIIGIIQPNVIDKIDTDYFKDTEYYYLVYWMSNIEMY